MTRSDRDLLRRAASLWGRLGGSVSSVAKAAAARENGKKGGRPPKISCVRCAKLNCGFRALDHVRGCNRFAPLVGVEGAKSPPIKRASEQSPRPRKGTRPSKQKNRLT